MRLTGGKQKLDYLLASIADYSAPLVFFITLFYCTNLIYKYSCKRMDSRIFSTILFEFLSDVGTVLVRAAVYANAATAIATAAVVVVATVVIPFLRGIFEPAPKNSAKLLVFFRLFRSLSFSPRVTNLNRFESIFIKRP